jgi:gliding motility-associated lipoprotein GldH
MKSKKPGWRLLAIAAVLVLYSSCDRQTLYHHYEPTSRDGWERSDTLLFTVTKAQKRAVVQREVELRVTKAYPFKNLHLVVEQTTLPQHQFRRDTINCMLTTSDGRIIGDGISLYQYRFPLSDISLNEGDSLCIHVSHDMKREILHGISDIGIRLTAY